MFEDVDLSEMDVEKELGGYPLAVLSLIYTHKSVPLSRCNFKGLIHTYSACNCPDDTKGSFTRTVDVVVL